MGQWTRLKRSTQRGSNGGIWHWLSRGLPGSGRGATVGRSPAPVLGFIPQVRKYHMEYIDRRRYAEARQQRHTAAITTSVFVLSDDDLVVTGLTTKSLRDLFEAALWRGCVARTSRRPLSSPGSSWTGSSRAASGTGISPEACHRPQVPATPPTRRRLVRAVPHRKP